MHDSLAHQQLCMREAQLVDSPGGMQACNSCWRHPTRARRSHCTNSQTHNAAGSTAGEVEVQGQHRKVVRCSARTCSCQHASTCGVMLSSVVHLQILNAARVQAWHNWSPAMQLPDDTSLALICMHHLLLTADHRLTARTAQQSQRR